MRLVRREQARRIVSIRQLLRRETWTWRRVCGTRFMLGRKSTKMNAAPSVKMRTT